MKKKYFMIIFASAAYIVFIILSFVNNFKPGKDIGNNFLNYSLDLLKVLPAAFILIGLFEVWVDSDIIKKHLGEKSGFKGFIWAVLLGGTIVGPVFVAFPIAQSLHKKGARLSVIFTFIGAASACRIPMTVFEASYLGVKFTIIRYVVSIPLIIISSILLGNYLSKKNYKINSVE